FGKRVGFALWGTEKKYRRYPALLFIAGIFEIVSLLAVFLGIVLIIPLAFNRDPSVFSSIVIALGVGLYFFASAEAIKVFLDIEENTRRSSDTMEQLRDQISQLNEKD
ncbi:MAG: hypothetical protein OES79_12430, partial [Planctomycetota bacterium]|nr:hypothetical protein [Planctomycetota bacterium]